MGKRKSRHKDRRSHKRTASGDGGGGGRSGKKRGVRHRIARRLRKALPCTQPATGAAGGTKQRSPPPADIAAMMQTPPNVADALDEQHIDAADRADTESLSHYDGGGGGGARARPAAVPQSQRSPASSSGASRSRPVDGSSVSSPATGTATADSAIEDEHALAPLDQATLAVARTIEGQPAYAPSTGAADRQPGAPAAAIDYDAVYEHDQESDLGSVQDHGSVIMHLLSQVSIGMDLTKIPLPTFILERRSLLEMFADFFAHPDLFVRISTERTAEQRMVATVRWYMSSFHAGRRGAIAKKPYNPILGETFRCHWAPVRPADVSPPARAKARRNNHGANGEHSAPVSSVTASGGVDDWRRPFPGAADDQLCFVAEQVSHHPPVSCFYAEHRAARMQCSGFIWTKSKFLGLSIGVHMVGQGRVTLLDRDETYVANFPSGYGRSILTTPWVELGGSVGIDCATTGYRATITFETKPFYGGKAHCITGEIYRPNSKSPFMTLKGEWNGLMNCKVGKDERPLLDVRSLPVWRKRCRPVAEQGDFESRRLWRHVTVALRHDDINAASAGKHWLEQRQRLEAKYRAANRIVWRPRCFEPAEGAPGASPPAEPSHGPYVYRWPLAGRADRRRRNSGGGGRTP